MGKQIGDLQIEKDMQFQRREWLVQRAGWWLLCAFVLAAFLGVFGRGPLSRASAAAEGSPVRVEYERFTRAGAASRMYLYLEAAASAGSREIRLNREYFNSVRIERITPEPERVAVGMDEVTLTFQMPDAIGGAVIVDLEPLDAGLLTVRVSADEGPSLTFTQFAYF